MDTMTITNQETIFGVSLLHAGAKIRRRPGCILHACLWAPDGTAIVPLPGHEGAQPSDQELHEFCNLGYAAKCSRLPAERDFDAVRFSVARDQGSRLLLWFVCETGHRPANHGTLEYDVERSQWIVIAL